MISYKKVEKKLKKKFLKKLKKVFKKVFKKVLKKVFKKVNFFYHQSSFFSYLSAFLRNLQQYHLTNAFFKLNI
jgi:hypothetical protein